MGLETIWRRRSEVAAIRAILVDGTTPSSYSEKRNNKNSPGSGPGNRNKTKELRKD